MDVTSATANFFCTARYRRSSSDANWRKEHFYKHPKMFFFFIVQACFRKQLREKVQLYDVFRCFDIAETSYSRVTGGRTEKLQHGLVTEKCCLSFSFPWSLNGRPLNLQFLNLSFSRSSPIVIDFG